MARSVERLETISDSHFSSFRFTDIRLGQSCKSTLHKCRKTREEMIKRSLRKGTGGDRTGVAFTLSQEKGDSLEVFTDAC